MPLLPPDRRDILKAGLLGAAGAAFGCTPSAPRRLADVPGAVVGGAADRGHLLRIGELAGREAPESERVAILIIGAGITGLMTAERLRAAGVEDLLIVDLEDVAGGTSRSGELPLSPHPWGAHYLPTPPPEARALRRTLRDLGLIVGEGSDGEPIYHPSALCPALEERVFEDGLWSAGIWPRLGASAEDEAQLAAFEAEIQRWIAARDEAGRPLFTLPTSACGHSAETDALEAKTAAAWLTERGLVSKRLRWYCEYATRDDYGSSLEQVSAWALIHYFAARERCAHHALLTWPEGNGWFVRELSRPHLGRLRLGQLCVSLRPLPVRGDATGPAPVKAGIRGDAPRWRALCWEARGQRLRAYDADLVVYAAPKFTLPYVVELEAESAAAARRFEYSPWLVANLAVSERPRGFGAPPAWDNVFYEGESLGYVTATHKTHREARAVLTWYRPLVGADDRAERAQLLGSTREQWLERCVADLSRAHPDILSTLERFDIYKWGHAMIRPWPGFLRGPTRAQLVPPEGLILAGADLAGLPLFEEAHDQGVAAAEAALARLGLASPSWR